MPTIETMEKLKAFLAGIHLSLIHIYDLKDQMLVLAPHEGIVPSDIWLTCRKKLMNNMKIQSARKATHTWLAGKIKCGNCGYALMSINNPVGKQYLRCTKRLDNKRDVYKRQSRDCAAS